ncbi:MAG: recombinase family protein [Minisyncoccia bacterium]
MQKEDGSGKKRAVIYLRARNGKPVDLINNLAAQEDFCRQYAEAHGYEVCKVIAELVGGQRMLERSGILDLLRYVDGEGRGTGAVIVDSLDRLARRHEDYQLLCAILKPHSAEIKVATNVETPPATQNCVDQMRGFLDKYLAEKDIHCSCCAEAFSTQEDA